VTLRRRIRSARRAGLARSRTKSAPSAPLALSEGAKGRSPRHQGVVGNRCHQEWSRRDPATYRSGAAAHPQREGMAEQPRRHGGWGDGSDGSRAGDHRSDLPASIERDDARWTRVDAPAMATAGAPSWSRRETTAFRHVGADRDSPAAAGCRRRCRTPPAQLEGIVMARQPSHPPRRAVTVVGRHDHGVAARWHPGRAPPQHAAPGSRHRGARPRDAARAAARGREPTRPAPSSAAASAATSSKIGPQPAGATQARPDTFAANQATP